MKEELLKEILGTIEGLKKFTKVPQHLKKQEPYKHRFVYNQALTDAQEAIKDIFNPPSDIT